MPTKQPTVLHVIPGLHTGGAELTLGALVTAKRERPVTQIVVDLMSSVDTDLADRLRAAGIEVHHLGGRSMLDFPRVVFQLSRLIGRLRPTAIQSWLYYADLASLWALDLSGQRKSTRLYWGIRSSDMDQSRYRRALAWTIRACAMQSGRPDAVVANSFAGRDVHRALGYTPRAFPVIPNGICTQRFAPDAAARAAMRASLGLGSDKPVVIHVARVDPMKDHASLIAVAKLLPEIDFVMVGAGTERLGAPPNLTALGIRRDLPSLYAAADLLLSTSIFGEGFPNVVGEAMACGLPVVVTDIGDARRIVGDTGAVVPALDVKTMASSIGLLLGEKADMRRERGIAARKWIEDRFSLDRMVSAFDALHLHAALPAAEAGD